MQTGKTWQVVTEFLGSVLGPRLLKSTDEDFPDKPHKDLSPDDAIGAAKWWDSWIERQNHGKKTVKK